MSAIIREASVRALFQQPLQRVLPFAIPRNDLDAGPLPSDQITVILTPPPTPPACSSCSIALNPYLPVPEAPSDVVGEQCRQQKDSRFCSSARSFCSGVPVSMMRRRHLPASCRSRCVRVAFLRVSIAIGQILRSDASRVQTSTASCNSYKGLSRANSIIHADRWYESRVGRTYLCPLRARAQTIVRTMSADTSEGLGWVPRPGQGGTCS